MHSVTATLLVPSASLPPERLRRVLGAMADAGFLYEREPGAGGHLWLHSEPESRDGATLDEAVDRFAMGEDEWSVALWTRAADVPGEWLEVHLTAMRSYLPPHRDELKPFVSVDLSLSFLPRTDEHPTLCREFVAWVEFLAGLVRPWYGRGFHFWGAAGDDGVLGSALERLEPQPIEWLNVFGPAYVERIGLGRLLSAPAWRVDFLTGGGVAVVLGPHPEPDDLTEQLTVAHRVAAHLGVPCRLNTPEEAARIQAEFEADPAPPPDPQG